MPDSTEGQMTPEQIKEMQEKIKNMSPEELKEFQKKQCIFCQIIAGKVQSKKIYEDEKVLAILDINPANPGHILLLPKEHYAILPQMSEEEIAYLFQVAKALSHAMLKALGCHGTNIFVANGIAAGQKAQHFMAHVIPRMEDDKIGMEIPERDIPESQLEQMQKMLARRLGQDKASSPPGVVEAEFTEKKERHDKPKEELKEQRQRDMMMQGTGRQLNLQIRQPSRETFEEPETQQETERQEETGKGPADTDDVLEMLGGPAKKSKASQKKAAAKQKQGKQDNQEDDQDNNGDEGKGGADLDTIGRLFGA